MKTKLILLAVVLLASVSAASGQSRTAERVVDIPFSRLDEGNPPNGSIRNLINGAPGTTPCAQGTTNTLAFKAAGVWQCPRLTPGTGSGDTTGPASSAAGEMVLFTDNSGKHLGRSNTLNGIPLLISGVVSVLASTGTGDVVRTSGSTLTSPTLISPTISTFNNAQHSHSTSAGGGQLNASNIFNTGTVPPSRVISGALTNNKCLRLSNVGQIEVAAEDCGTGSGGSPGGVSGNLTFNESGAFGGISNSAYDSVTGRLTINQKADGSDTFYSQRATNTSPTGSFLRFRNSDGSADLFVVSVDGSVSLFNKLTSTNMAAPAVPGAGRTAVWTDLTDKNLKAQDDAGNVSITLRPVSCSGTDKISSISSAGVVTCTADQGGTGTGVITLNTLNTSDQTFVAVDDANIDLSINSSVSTHTFTVAWVGALTKIRQHGATMYSDQSNTVSAGAQSFAAAASLAVPTSAGASPATNGFIAYDSSSNTLEYGENGSNRIVVNTAGSQTLDNKTLANTTTANLRDTLLTLQDNVDSTKTLNFELSGITSGANRVVTIPNANSVTVIPTTATANQVVSNIDGAGVQQKVQLAFSNLSGSMGPTQGGTGLTAISQGDLLFGDAANSWARLSKSASATRYLANTGASNNPQWDLVNVTNGITGIVPSDNGGTGNAFFQVSGPSTSIKTFTFPNASAAVLTDNAAVTIAQGGSGQTTQTAAFNALDPLTTKGDIIVHDGTNSVRQAVGTNGFVLLADSTQTTGVRWGAISASAGGSGTQLQYNLAGALAGLSTVTTDGTIVTFAAGDLKIGSIALASAPTPALGKFYVQTDNGKLYFGIDGTNWGEVFVSGLSAVNLASANVSGVLPFANGGTNQTAWTASRCVQVNSAGTALESAAAICGAGGGSGTVTVVSSGSLTSTALVTGGGAQTLQTPAATVTLDSSGNISTPGTLTIGAGGSTAGYVGLGQGTAQTTVTSTIGLTAPTSITAYNLVFPGAAADGVLLWSNASNVVTGVFTATTGTSSFVRSTTPTLVTYFQMAEATAPANPAADNLRLYVKDVSGVSKLCSLDSAGTETCGLGGGGGGSGTINAGATNAIPKYVASTTVDDSLLSDNGTTLTYTGSGGFSLTGSGAGYLQIAPGTAPTVVASQYIYAAPATAPGGGLLYLLPSDTPTNGEQLTANISGTTVTLSWDAAGSGGSGDAVTVNGSAATDANFINTSASGTVPSVTWSLNTAPTPDEVSISAIGAASTTEAGIITTGTQSLAGIKIFGHSAALGRLGQLFEITTSATYGGATFNTFSTTPDESALLDFNRSNSATKGAQTVVVADDNLGQIFFRGSDGTSFRDAAAIKGTVDGTPGTADMPGRLSFFTTSDGEAVLTERWRITNAGHLLTVADNAYDVGASGANRPRNVFVGTSTVTPKVTWTGSVQDNSGSGSPEGVVTAAVGSVYRRTDGGASTTLYVKESGAGNTGWVAYGAASGGITSLEGQTGATQTFTDDTNVTIVSGSNAHVITWAGTLAASRGGTGNGAPAQDQVIVGNGTGYDLKTLPSCSNATTEKLLYNSTTNTFSCGSDQTSGGGGGITTLNTLTGATQTFSKTDDTNVTLTITSTGTDHNFALGFTGTLADARVADVLTITKASNLTSNGFVKTSGGDGTLSVDTNTYLTGNQTVTLSGDVTGAGATSITTVVANLPSGVTQAGFLAATAIAAPSTPAAGTGRIYVDSTSKNLAVKDDAGVVKHGVQTQSAVSNSFVTAIDNAGTVTVAQPSFSNLSGSATDAQIPNNITVDLATLATTASAGDSATAFFSTGVLEVAIGGTGLSSGTSGGIPYFSGSTSIASSAALTANLPVIGGGTGAAPTVGSRSGNTTAFVTTTGTLTSGRCAEWDASGNLIQAAAACGSGGSGTITAGATNFIPKYTASTTLDDSLLSDDATTLTYTGSGGVSAPLFSTTGSGAGYMEMAEGTAPTLVANRFQIFAPADVAAGGLSFILPAAGATGFLKTTNSSGAMTLSIDTTSYAPLVSPSFTTPVLGAATATSINGLTITTSTGTLTIANGKTLTVNNSLTFAGTDSTTMTFPSTSATIARTDAANTFTGTQTVGALVATTINGNTFTTGTGVLTIAAGKTATISNTLTFVGTDSTTQTFQASDTIVGRATTDTLTNKTFDVAGTGNVFTSSSKPYFAAAGCVGTTPSSFFDLPVATPAVAACDSATSQKGVLDFADTSGGFLAETNFQLPDDLTGTVDVTILWKSTATSGSVVWQLATSCTNTDATQTDDQAFNAFQTVTTATAGVASRVNASTITSVTLTNCSAGDLLHLQLKRDGNHASDSLSATARFIGMTVTVRRSQ